MKKFLILTIGILLYNLSGAQSTLFGTATQHQGSIFSIKDDGTEPKLLIDFTSTGSSAKGNLIESNGKFWGMAERGGVYNSGVIFSLNIDGTGYTRVHSFNYDTQGGEPNGSLIESDGKLWGMTPYGGIEDAGVIFTIDTDGSNYNVVHEFDGDNGGEPFGDLLESNGKLWGVTDEGGTNMSGVIFSLNPDGTDFTVVHEFDDTNGSHPVSGLIESVGKLWGMTLQGGAGDDGVIFSLNTDGSGFSVVHEFDELNGQSPQGSLVESNGKLWGMTESGGANSEGVIFSIDNDGTNFTIVHDFVYADAGTPQGGLIESNNKLWGTVRGDEEGGVHGIIFSLNTDGSSFNVEHEFNDTNGSSPFGDLLESNGKLWGLTQKGGTDRGVIFSLDTDGSNYSIAHNFTQQSNNGNNPEGKLIESNGKLWGMTRSGGNTEDGTIYSLNTDGSGYTVHHEFDDTNGYNPYGTLYRNGDKFWGMTRDGGSADRGVIFSIDIDGSNFTTAHEFAGTDGDNPYGSLIESNGKLWGMTERGGNPTNFGTIFSIDTDGTNHTVIHEFSNTDGAQPFGSLIESGAKLWGMTAFGGTNGDGVIFSINSDGTGFTIEHEFDQANGRAPYGELIENNGKLWGITRFGGTSNEGVIFSIDTDGTNYSKVYDLNNTDGSNPQGSLIENNGKLWGMTRNGGENNVGTIFSINLDGTGFEKVLDFNSEDIGGNPDYGTFLAIDLPDITSSASVSVAENNSGTIYSATSNESVTFSLGSEKDEALFTLTTGTLSFTNSPDFENPLDEDGDNQYLLDLTAENAEGFLTTIELTITVTNVTPSFTSGVSASIPENTTGTVYTITADESNSYSLGTEDDENFFTLTDDKLSFLNTPDYETPMDSDENNTYVAEIIATDDAGNASAQTVTITVTNENEGISVANPITDQSLESGFASSDIDLSSVFEDEDGDALTYSVTSSNITVVNVSNTGNTLTITEVGPGTSTIVVSANDGLGETISDEFVVTITEPPLSLADEFSLEVYPNPTADFININADKVLQINLINLSGQTLKSITQQTVRLDLRGLNSGTYLLKISDGDSSVTRRIIKAN